MTTQKAQSKIKSSKVAITVLSILLAIAVVSTIVLAALSVTRNATTTITFGGGLTLELQTATDSNFKSEMSGDTLTITYTGGSAPTAALTIPTIQGKVNMDAYIGYKVAVTVTDRGSQDVTMTYGTNTFTSPALGSSTDTLQVAITPGSDFTATADNNGTYTNTASPDNAITTADNFADLLDLSISVTGSANYSLVAGYIVEINIEFIAADSQSDDGASTVTEHSYGI